MPTCVFCDQPLTPVRNPLPAPGQRRAYDPHRGRLWDVCPACHRWSPVPLALRWEILEASEEAFRSRGRERLRSDHLVLARLGDADAGPGDAPELVRVGAAPRPELAPWRYGDRMPTRSTPAWRRMLEALPPPPVGGYEPYGLGPALPPARWLASPFQEHAAPLGFAFAHAPFALSCPSCRHPLALEPSEFQDVRLVETGSTSGVEVRCALCGERVVLPGGAGRPGLRLGLAVVNGPRWASSVAREAALELERTGGASRFLRELRRDAVPVGDLVPGERRALAVALDEEAEAEALEAEWQDAEEIAAIMDSELTRVPGFEAFRRRVLGEPDPTA